MADGMGAMRRWRVLLAAFVLIALAACGGGGNAAVELDDDVARLQPGDRPVRFRLDTEVPEELQKFVVETLGWVHADLGDSGPLTIHVYSDEERFVTAYTGEFGISSADARRQMAAGETAFTSPGGHIWVYLTNFEDRPVLGRRIALFHEYAHTLQHWQAEVAFQSTVPAERSFIPRWLIEGCAEYLAVRTGVRRRLVDGAGARAVIVERAKASDEPLEAVETAGEASFLGGTGNAYTLGWLACERLAAAKGEDAVAHGFWLAFAKQREWHAAFADAFGLTPAAFYADFATFRTTL